MLASAIAAGMLMLASLALVRTECVRLTAAAFAERTLRQDVSARLQNELIRRQQQPPPLQNEPALELLKSLKSAKRYRSRRGVLGSIFRAVAKFQSAAPVVPPKQFEIPPAPTAVEVAAVAETQKRQEGSVRRIELLTLVCLVSGLSAALLFLMAGRNLWRTLRFVIAQNSQSQAAAGVKINALLEWMADAAVAMRDLSKRLGEQPTHKPVTVVPPPAVRPAIDTSGIPPLLNAAETALAEIAQLTEAIRESSFKTNILALNASIEAAHAGDRGAGFGIVAGEMKSQAAAFAGSAEAIDARLASVRAQLKGFREAVNSLQAEKIAPVMVPVPARAASVSPEIPERLSALANDLDRFTGKRKQPSKPLRRKIK